MSNSEKGGFPPWTGLDLPSLFSQISTISPKQENSPIIIGENCENMMTSSPDEENPPKFSLVEGIAEGGYAAVVKVELLSERRQDDNDSNRSSCDDAADDGAEVDLIPTGSFFALKVVGKRSRSDDESFKRQKFALNNELKFMTQVAPSPFLQQCYYAFESPTCVYFALELITGGDFHFHLLNQLNKKQNIYEEYPVFLEEQVQIVMSELYLALEHLHNHHIIHRDVKIENIMLDGVTGHLKLIDFGVALEITEEISPMMAAGSLMMMAPELIIEKTGGRHTDWWAFGILAFELFTGKTPWASATNNQVIKREIVSKPIILPSYLSANAAAFLNSLLCRDVNLRLGSRADSDIKKCPFFKSIDWIETASLRAKPAFNPSTYIASKRDKDGALKAYFKFTNQGLNWFSNLF